MRRAKILATVGPASADAATLEALIRAGVDGFRLNFSHGTLDQHRETLARIRAASAAAGRLVAVLGDLSGPKIRCGTFAAGPVELREGATFTLTTRAVPGDAEAVSCTYPLARDLRVGDVVLLDDGLLRMRVTAVTGDDVVCRVEVGGTLSDRKGINVPGATLSVPALTEKDRTDAAAGCAMGVDFFALSFVRTAADLTEAKALLGDTPLIAKVEKPEAVNNLDEVIGACEGVMVARGDLGVETPLEDVPVVQKRLINSANLRNRLVITATQMLDSMERNPRPTRAEVTDVANAIVDGTDSVMLSGETATGSWPVHAVEVMDRVARSVEQSPFLHLPSLEDLPDLDSGRGTVTRAACYAVRDRPRHLLVFTWSGQTAILASKSRPPRSTFAFTPDPRVCDALSMAWGVVPLRIPDLDNFDALIVAAEKLLLDRGLIEDGDEVVVLAGDAPIRGGNTLMKVETVDGRSAGSRG